MLLDNCFLSLRKSVLLVRDLFQPVHNFSVQLLLKREVRHASGGRRAMPVLDASRNPNDVSLANHLNRATPLLNPADPICDDQDLAKRMGVPCRPRSGLERYLATGRPGWFLRVEERLNANRAREAIRSACDNLLRIIWHNRDLRATNLCNSNDRYSREGQRRAGRKQLPHGRLALLVPSKATQARS
jgi:hypothetical protein